MNEESDDDQLRALAAVGRKLLAFEMESAADDLQVEFTRAAKKARNTDRITEDDVRQLADAVDRADMLVDAFYTACPEADRPPAIENKMSAEELQEFVELSL